MAMVKVADSAPVVVGLNRKTISAVVFAGMFKGPAGVAVNAGFELVIELTVKVALPVL